jgi:hypothetical protein
MGRAACHPSSPDSVQEGTQQKRLGDRKNEKQNKTQQQTNTKQTTQQKQQTQKAYQNNKDKHTEAHATRSLCAG